VLHLPKRRKRLPVRLSEKIAGKTTPMRPEIKLHGIPNRKERYTDGLRESPNRGKAQAILAREDCQRAIIIILHTLASLRKVI